MSLLGCYWHVLPRRFPHDGTALTDTDRTRADLNRARWIQGPECWPLHHETILVNPYELSLLSQIAARCCAWPSQLKLVRASWAVVMHVWLEHNELLLSTSSVTAA